MKIKMDYGREGLEIDVPDYSDILIPNNKNEISDPEKKITDNKTKSDKVEVNPKIDYQV